MGPKFTVNNHRTPFHSTFDVGRSMFDVQFFVAFSFFAFGYAGQALLLPFTLLQSQLGTLRFAKETVGSENQNEQYN